MYTVLDDNLQVKGRLSLNNGQGNTTFFSDTITTQMATDNANDPAGLTTVDYTNQDKQGNAKQWSHTLTISVEATDLGTSINTTDYLMYFDSVADHYYLMKVINTSTDRNSGFITVSAINAAIFELGKQLIQAEQTLAQVDLKTFVSKMYKNAPFSLRVADDNLTVIDYVVSANTSLQALLQELQTKYDVDVDSWVELDTTGRIVDRVLYFGHLGSDNGELIRYGGAKGFENMTATEVSDIIYTKLYVTGKTDDKDATKGHIGTVNNGLEYITDDDANQLMYAIGASQQQPVYLEGTITNSLLSEPKALLEWAKQQIGIFNHPRFNYTVSPLHDQIVALGDTVTVQDFHIKPEILVTSKVIQKTVSFASPETNTFVLGEFSSIFTDNMNKSANVISLIKKDVTVTQEAAQQAADKAELARQQADEAHNEAVKAQADAYQAIVSADGKAVILTVKSLDDLPKTAKEGTQAWYNAANGTYLYAFLDDKWVEDINPTLKQDIANSVATTLDKAKISSESLINDNNQKFNFGINEEGKLVSGFAGNEQQVVIKGKAITLDGDVNVLDTFTVKRANIASGAIGTAQIGDAAITSAKIASLDARKITTGQLSGPSLNIDLDQGNVFFQKGRIYDSKTQIDVNIDQAYIRTTNGGGSATLQNGRLLLTGSVYNSGQTIDSNPYFSVSASLLPTFSNQPDGAVGSLLQSKDFSEISVNGHGNIGFLANMAAERGAGIGISAVTGTYIAGNDQGVILSGGKDIGGMTFAESPNFVVGYDDSKGVDGKGVGGNSILARASNFVVAANNFSIDKNGNGKVSNGFFARNMGTNGYHTIVSQDNGRVYFSGGNNNLIDISVKTVSQSSLVSLKENIRDIDPKYALSEILKSDVKQYNFIGESKDNIRVSPMIDDVNHELYIPKDWLAEDGKSVENYTITGYLIQSIKALQQQIKVLKQG
ncbi:phage tail spike protein [Leuconostoc citreum]